ncbi:MAG: hypothetical protein AAF823_02810 [Planctomycetota bacterium]
MNLPEQFDADHFYARAKSVFKPFAPIELVEQFQGRNDQIIEFKRELSNDGRHAILFGDRGVGKTSFANLAGFWSGRPIDRQVLIPCSQDSSFESISASIFHQLGIDGLPTGWTIEDSASASATLGFGESGFAASGSKKVTANFETAVGGVLLGPHLVAEKIADCNATVILDEYDRFSCEHTDARIAELIKRLSDTNSSTKLVIVGVATTPSELIRSHSSLDRSCAQIQIPRMSRSEMEQILHHGAYELGAKVPFEVAQRVVDMADGFPYFVHLMALNMCSAYADRREANSSGDTNFTRDDFQQSVIKAVSLAEQTLRDSYMDAVRDGNREKSAVTKVLDGIALSQSIEVLTDDIGYNLRLIHKSDDLTKRQIQSHINHLSKAGEESILSRVRPACYKFSDPRMHAFIRIRLQEKFPEVFSGQLNLPFDSASSQGVDLSGEHRDLLVNLYSRIPHHTAESITYSDDFDILHEEFQRQSGESISKQSLWRQLQNLRKAGRLRIDQPNLRSTESKLW